MLNALMDGRALTATELTKVAGIAPQTASGHLSRMIGVGLLNVEKQGRHRYYRLAAPSVAQMLESIMQVASELAPRTKKLAVGPKEAALRMTAPTPSRVARFCTPPSSTAPLWISRIARSTVVRDPLHGENGAVSGRHLRQAR
jgi:DNA-binding IclR family transcriptional regulator